MQRHVPGVSSRTAGKRRRSRRRRRPTRASSRPEGAKRLESRDPPTALDTGTAAVATSGGWVPALRFAAAGMTEEGATASCWMQADPSFRLPADSALTSRTQAGGLPSLSGGWADMYARGVLAFVAVWAVLSRPTKGLYQEHFTLEDNLVHVTAVLDGKPVSAVLDSGTSQIIVDVQMATRLGIPISASNNTAVGAGRGSQALYPLKLAVLDFKRIVLHDVSASALSLLPFSQSARFHVDAILGGPLFQNHTISVDYPHQTIVLDDPKPTRCENPLPVELISGVPVLKVELQTLPGSPKRVLHLVVDMGTRHFAALLGGKVLDTEDVQQLTRGVTLQQIGTGSGGKSMGRVADVYRMTIGNKVYPGLSVAFTRDVKAFNSGVIDGTLGVPLWKGAVISFDYPHQRVCISTPGSL